MLTVDGPKSLGTFLNLEEKMPAQIREILEQQGINYLCRSNTCNSGWIIRGR